MCLLAVSSSQLDGYHSGNPDDLRPASYANRNHPDFSDMSQVTLALEAARPQAMNLVGDLSTIAILSLMAWGLGYFGQPHILVRFMAADSVKSIPNARRIGMTWMTLCLGGAVAAGFFGIAYFQQHPELAAVVNANPETVFMELTKILFNPWIAGVVLAAILAAVMSTLSCQLLVCSSTLTEDFYKSFLRKNASQKELVWVGRLMVLLIALLAIWMAGNPESKVLGLVAYAWAGFGAAFGPLIILSLFWKHDPEWCLGRYDCGCNCCDPMEKPVCRHWSVRNHSRFHLFNDHYYCGELNGQSADRRNY